MFLASVCSFAQRKMVEKLAGKNSGFSGVISVWWPGGQFFLKLKYP